VRSFTCKNCGGRVFVKAIPERLVPLLLGEDRSIAFDMVVRLFGGRAGAWPILESLAQAMEQPDHHAAVSHLLHEADQLRRLVSYQIALGLDYIITQREVMAGELERLRTEHGGDPERGIFITCRYGACEFCRTLEHQWMSFDEAADRNLLPCLACTTPAKHAASFCRCLYYAARPEHESIVYMGGGTGMAGVRIEQAEAWDQVIAIEFVGGPLDGNQRNVVQASVGREDVVESIVSAALSEGTKIAGGRYVWSGPTTLEWEPAL
jgi:hypothetical protein